MSVLKENTFDILEHIKDNNIYVNDCVNVQKKLESKSIDDLIKISWSSLLEFKVDADKEISLSKSSSVSNVDSNDECVFKEKNMINIDDIIKLEPRKLDDLKLLEYNTLISGFLRKNIKNHIDFLLRSNVCSEIENQNENDLFNWNKNIKYLGWISSSCFHLSKKLNLPLIKNNFNNKRTLIPRSSYKFCDHNYECEYNYDTKHNGCYAQHYVYNNVYSDIESLLMYFRTDENNNYENINMKETKKCIDTISYVLNHMYEELKNIIYYNNNKDISKLHIERKPKKKLKKKIYRRNKN